MKNLVIVGLLFLILLLSACGQDDKKSVNEDKDTSTASEVSASEEEAEDNKKAEELKDNIAVTMNVDSIVDDSSGKVNFKGETNLPDDAELMFTVSSRNGYSAQSKEFVYDGEFETEEFSSKGEALPVGEYDLKVTLSIPSTQKDSFVEVAGSNYEYLVGDLMDDSVDMGKTMKYKTSFTIDKEVEKEYISVEEAKEIVEFNAVGEYDELVSFNVEDGDIKVTINLGPSDPFEPEDLAVNRYSSLSDELLNRDDWDSLTVEFVGVGTVSMDRSDSESNEYGEYFPTLEIEERLN